MRPISSMPCLSFILPLLRALHVAYSSRLFHAERDPVASLGLALGALPRRPCIYPFRLIPIRFSKILTGIALEAHANFAGCKLPHNSATYLQHWTWSFPTLLVRLLADLAFLTGASCRVFEASGQGPAPCYCLPLVFFVKSFLRFLLACVKHFFVLAQTFFFFLPFASCSFC